MAGTVTSTAPEVADLLVEQAPPLRPALVLLHLHGSARAGEVALVPPTGGVLGREGDLLFGRQLPDERPVRGRPLDHPSLSRRALEVRPRGKGLAVRVVGRNALRVDGAPRQEADLEPGACLELVGVAAFLVVRRPEVLEDLDLPVHPLGGPDRWGMVGESPPAWRLRERILRLAPRRVHVLVHGPTGAGKEAVARGLHEASGRAGAWVSRNASTFPESLVDAELFGNVAGYPNVGMPERPGLVGRADGGTLFLDEIAELPVSLQARLLRVMDGGEYHRLGASRARVSDLRLIGATNREPDALKSDLAARFTARVRVPPLEERREDVPLIAAHLLRGMAREDPAGAGRFVDDAGLPRWTTALVARLASRAWPTNVRGLAAFLWERVDGTRGGCLDAPPPEPRPPPPELTPERIREELVRQGGSRERTWRALGLRSRHQLYRLLQRYGIQ